MAEDQKAHGHDERTRVIKMAAELERLVDKLTTGPINVPGGVPDKQVFRTWCQDVLNSYLGLLTHTDDDRFLTWFRERIMQYGCVGTPHSLVQHWLAECFKPQQTLGEILQDRLIHYSVKMGYFAGKHTSGQELAGVVAALVAVQGSDVSVTGLSTEEIELCLWETMQAYSEDDDREASEYFEEARDQRLNGRR